MKMARGRKFGIWQPWKVERKYCGIDVGKMKMARGRRFGVWQPWKVWEEKKRGGGGKHAWGLASPGSGEARRKVHLQSQPCLSESANKSGGEEKMEKVVNQGLANPESGTCDGNLSHTSDPV
jgi:hypothetical protein